MCDLVVGRILFQSRYHFGIVALENVTQHDWEVFIAVPLVMALGSRLQCFKMFVSLSWAMLLFWFKICFMFFDHLLRAMHVFTNQFRGTVQVRNWQQAAWTAGYRGACGCSLQNRIPLRFDQFKNRLHGTFQSSGSRCNGSWPERRRPLNYY